MKKYRTGGYGVLIEEVEVLRETDSTVWFMSNWNGKPREERAKKGGSYRQYHDSWDAAKAYLLNNAQRAIEHVQGRLQRERSKLGQIESLKNPAAMIATPETTREPAAEHTQVLEGVE